MMPTKCRQCFAKPKKSAQNWWATHPPGGSTLKNCYPGAKFKVPGGNGYFFLKTLMPRGIKLRTEGVAPQKWAGGAATLWGCENSDDYGIPISSSSLYFPAFYLSPSLVRVYYLPLGGGDLPHYFVGNYWNYFEEWYCFMLYLARRRFGAVCS